MKLMREDFDQTAVIGFDDSRLDSLIAVEFKDQFRELAADGKQRYILDLSQVEFMDSSGLGAVVAVYKFLGTDVRFDLAGLKPAVDRVFKLTRMDGVFAIYPSLDAALAVNPVPKGRFTAA